MVVKAKGGALVRLRDVATVELGAQTTNSSIAMNGENAVFIGINATPTGNPLTLVQGVRKLLPEIERNLPPSVTMKVPTIRPSSSSRRSTRSNIRSARR